LLWQSLARMITFTSTSRVTTSAIGLVTSRRLRWDVLSFNSVIDTVTLLRQWWVVLSLQLWSSDFTRAEVSHVITSDIGPVTSLRQRWVVLSLQLWSSNFTGTEVSCVITSAIGQVISLRLRWVVLSLRSSVQWLYWGKGESGYHFGHRSSDFTEAEVRRVIISVIGPMTSLRLRLAVLSLRSSIQWLNWGKGESCYHFGHQSSDLTEAKVSRVITSVIDPVT